MAGIGLPSFCSQQTPGKKWAARPVSRTKLAFFQKEERSPALPHTHWLLPA